MATTNLSRRNFAKGARTMAECVRAAQRVQDLDEADRLLVDQVIDRLVQKAKARRSGRSRPAIDRPHQAR